MENLRSSFKSFKLEYGNRITLKDYLLITSEFNKFIIDNIIEGYKVTLPYRMGYLFIQGKKQIIKIDEKGNVKGLAPNWAKTKELRNNDKEFEKNKSIIYCLNHHTDNVRYKYIWSKLHIYVKYKMFYSLRMTRYNKRILSYNIKNNKQYYVK